jgi:uncharacterized membrane protein YtjA (UPF0391 family)
VTFTCLLRTTFPTACKSAQRTVLRQGPLQKSPLRRLTASAALFGFTDLSAASADVARVLFYIFVVIFLVLLVLGLMGARAVRGP